MPQDSSQNPKPIFQTEGGNDPLAPPVLATDNSSSPFTPIPPVTPVPPLSGNSDLGDSVQSTTPPIISDAPPLPSSVVLSPPPQSPKKYGGKKTIATIFAIVFLVVGAISTVLLVQRQSLLTSQAWECDKYVFEVTRDGTVTARNGSTRNEPAQQADVFINNVLVQTVNVPALNAGQAVTLGSVTVPSSAGFTWKVEGDVDCDDSGSYSPQSTPTPTITPTVPVQSTTPTPSTTQTLTPTATVTPTTSQASASCSDVIAYDENWNQLTATELASLKSGDIVRFAVFGTASSGTFDKARFTINGTLQPEITTKKPSSQEFYDEYTIPAGTVNFTVSAQVHHSTLGWF